MGRNNKSLRSPWKKCPLGSIKTGKIVKKSYYESPLKHIQLSSKRWELKQAQRRMMKKNAQLARKKKDLSSPKKGESLQDSVIILSDNESETTPEGLTDNCNIKKRKRNKTCHVGDPNDSSVIIIEPLCTLSTEDQQTPRCLRSSTKLSNTPRVDLGTCKNKKQKRIKPLNNNLPCHAISDAQNLIEQRTTVNVDGENIAPVSGSPGSDDIVVVWSSENNPSLEDKCTLQDRTKEHGIENQEESNRLFMVDCSPNPQNLKCLERNKHIGKRKKVLSKEIDRESNNLPFSKAGLKLPTAYDFSKQMVARQAVSVVNPFKTLQQQTPNSLDTTTCTTSNEKDSKNESAPSGKLREIIIDGNNIAMQYDHFSSSSSAPTCVNAFKLISRSFRHTNGKTFSEMGLKIVIDYFKERGHTVKAFVPQHRRSVSRCLLEQLYLEGVVVFTPSRKICGRRITPYDDRFILEYATVCDGIVVSSDQYRDLYLEKPEWRNTIANRLLAPTFVGDYVMFPEDPLGRRGPRLAEFLRC